ncbi:hypothetical protein Q3H58_001834 [Pseudomonas psychrotolerans]|nr:hypothetical protein [Pseudomonas psychrotolerans]
MGEQVAQHAERRGSQRRRQAEQILERIETDEHGGAAHETEQHRGRDEVGHRAEPERPHHQLQQADQQRHRQGQVDIGAGAGQRQGRQCRQQGQGIGVGRSGHHMPAGARQGRDDAGYHRPVDPILRRQSGQGSEGHALG